MRSFWSAATCRRFLLLGFSERKAVTSHRTPKLASIQSLEYTRGAHAAADAHRDHAIASVAALQFAQDAGGQFRAGAAERMAQSDGAAVDVHFVGIESQRLDYRHRLGRERFVKFDYVDLIERQAL